MPAASENGYTPVSVRGSAAEEHVFLGDNGRGNVQFCRWTQPRNSDLSQPHTLTGVFVRIQDIRQGADGQGTTCNVHIMNATNDGIGFNGSNGITSNTILVSPGERRYPGRAVIENVPVERLGQSSLSITDVRGTPLATPIQANCIPAVHRQLEHDAGLRRAAEEALVIEAAQQEAQRAAHRHHLIQGSAIVAAATVLLAGGVRADTSAASVPPAASQANVRTITPPQVSSSPVQHSQAPTASLTLVLSAQTTNADGSQGTAQSTYQLNGTPDTINNAVSGANGDINSFYNSHSSPVTYVPITGATITVHGGSNTGTITTAVQNILNALAVASNGSLSSGESETYFTTGGAIHVSDPGNHLIAHNAKAIITPQEMHQLTTGANNVANQSVGGTPNPVVVITAPGEGLTGEPIQIRISSGSSNQVRVIVAEPNILDPNWAQENTAYSALQQQASATQAQLNGEATTSSITNGQATGQTTDAETAYALATGTQQKTGEPTDVAAATYYQATGQIPPNTGNKSSQQAVPRNRASRPPTR